jgi:hypothetical protein
MWMALARLGLTLKRTPARVRASEQDRPDVAAARAGWALAAPAPDPARLVFPDETWATANVVRARGRAPRGERLAAAVPHGHWHTTTFLCGLRADGAASGPTVRPQGRRCGLRADGAASGPTVRPQGRRCGLRADGGCGLRADGAASGPTVRPQGRRCGLRADGAASGPTVRPQGRRCGLRADGAASGPTVRPQGRRPGRPVRARRRDHRARLPGLRRTGARAHPRGRGCRGPRQPRQPRGQGRARGGRGARPAPRSSTCRPAAPT